MTTTREIADRHLDDGELVRLLDGEAEAAERAMILRHLAGCDVCESRRARLEFRSESLTTLLAETAAAIPAPPRPLQPPLPSRRPVLGSAWLRAAAAVLALGIGLAASPARAWLIEGWHRVATAIAAMEASSDAPHEATPDTAAGTGVIFDAPMDELIIEIENPQAGGTLTLHVAEAGPVRASVTHGASDEGFLVLPGVLTIQNSPTSVADYHVTVPASLGRVRVTNAGRALGTLDPQATALGTEIVFPLAAAPDEP